MSGAFPLDELAPDLRKLIVSYMYAACKPMTVRQLCTLRLVNVRMAQAFYKRCIMLTLSHRYTPLMFPLEQCGPGESNKHGGRFYPLHSFFGAPTLLPQRRIDTLDREQLDQLRRVACHLDDDDKYLPPRPPSQTPADFQRIKESYSLMSLYTTMMANYALRTTSPETREELLATHRKDICVHLYPQEVQLFGLRERPTTRPKAMDPIRNDDLTALVGINHATEWGRFAWM